MRTYSLNKGFFAHLQHGQRDEYMHLVLELTNKGEWGNNDHFSLVFQAGGTFPEKEWYGCKITTSGRSEAMYKFVHKMSKKIGFNTSPLEAIELLGQEGYKLFSFIDNPIVPYGLEEINQKGEVQLYALYDKNGELYMTFSAQDYKDAQKVFRATKLYKSKGYYISLLKDVDAQQYYEDYAELINWVNLKNVFV